MKLVNEDISVRTLPILINDTDNKPDLPTWRDPCAAQWRMPVVLTQN